MTSYEDAFRGSCFSDRAAIESDFLMEQAEETIKKPSLLPTGPVEQARIDMLYYHPNLYSDEELVAKMVSESYDAVKKYNELYGKPPSIFWLKRYLPEYWEYLGLAKKRGWQPPTQD